MEEHTQPMYVVLPEAYSGDKWHFAAFLVLEKILNPNDPKIKAIVIRKSQAKDNIENIGKQTKQFFEDVHLNHLIKYISGSNLKSNWEKRALDEASKLTAYSKDYLFSTMYSTSIIMHYVEEFGRKTVVTILKNVFTGEPFEDKPKIKERVQNFFRDSQKVLLVNMRMAPEKTQHNITLRKYRQIESICIKHGVELVRVGAYNKYDKCHRQNKDWISTLEGRYIDIYSVLKFSSETDNKWHEPARNIAYFWACVSEVSQVIGFIGGRSGSLDVAAFMGVRVFAWDLEEKTKQEWVRLFMMHPILSVGKLQPRGYKEVNSNSPERSENEDYTGDLLNSDEIKRWMDGEQVFPSNIRIPSTNLKAVESNKLYELKYMTNYLPESPVKKKRNEHSAIPKSSLLHLPLLSDDEKLNQQFQQFHIKNDLQCDLPIEEGVAEESHTDTFQTNF